MRKFERFCVVDGKAVIRIRKMGSDKVCEYKVSGEDIKVIDMPVLHTHNLENVGQRQLTTVFWISEIYDDKNPDTFFEEI